MCDRDAAALQGEIEVMRVKKMALLSTMSVTAATLPVATGNKNLPVTSVACNSPGQVLTQDKFKSKLKSLRKKNDFLRVRLGEKVGVTR